MTKKDYIKIAAVLNRHTPSTIGQLKVLDFLIRDLIQMLKQDNPRFDTSKFLAASYKQKAF